MGVGRLELRSHPLTLAIDTWAMRKADLHQMKPADFTAMAKERGRGLVLEAIGEMARQGDALARIEDHGRPVVELARASTAGRNVTSDDLTVRFLTPPAIAWGGGGLEMRYSPSVDLWM